jgi:hypothetical protein
MLWKSGFRERGMYEHKWGPLIRIRRLKTKAGGLKRKAETN